MKDWRCRKTINMDKALYDRINETIFNGLQSKFLGAVIEEYFNALPTNTEEAYGKIAELLVRCCAQREKEDGQNN